MTMKYYSYEETHRSHNSVKLKLCVKCMSWKEYRYFRKDQFRRDGLKSWCGECNRAYDREYYQKDKKLRKISLRYEERHRNVLGVEKKLCSFCRVWKDYGQFHKYCKSKDGLHRWCKECKNKIERDYYEQIRNAGRKNLRYEDRHRVVRGIKQKFCRKCKEWKTESEFHRNIMARGGLENWCKKCHKTKYIIHMKKLRLDLTL